MLAVNQIHKTAVTTIATKKIAPTSKSGKIRNVLARLKPQGFQTLPQTTRHVFE